MLNKMALLAVLGVSLVASAEAEAGATTSSWDWNKFYSDSPDTSDPKSVISSGHTGQSITEGTYNGVTFGNANYEENVAEYVKSSSNEGTIESGAITQNTVIGGRAFYSGASQNMTVQANGNKVTFKTGSSFVLDTPASAGSEYGIFGGYARENEKEVGTGEANGNEVFIDSGVSLNFTENYELNIFGGYVHLDHGGEGTASGNKVTIVNPSIEGSNSVYITGGGAQYGTTVSACNNELSVTGGKYTIVRGGYAGGTTANVNSNKVVLTDVDSYYVLGGHAYSSNDSIEKYATANNNTVVLNGGTFSGTEYDVISWVYGGFAYSPNGTNEAVNNRVELRNGTAGAPDFAGTALLYGGFARSGWGSDAVDGTSTGNSLNFFDVKGMKAGNIGYFQILNYEYSEMHAGDVILELTGISDAGTDQKTSIAKAEVTVTANLYGRDGGEFETGDQVVLLRNANGIDAEDIATSVTAAKGATLLYDAVIETSEDKTELLLTSRGTKVNPGTKAIAEGAAAGLALASESSNAAIEALRDLSLSFGSITPFVHVQASSMRHETGSSINMSTVSLLAGLGTGIETAAGKLSAGAFFEYGKGSYTTNNSFDNRSDIDGDGNSWYMGGGILAKMEFLQTGPGHFYLEGSAHMGTLHNEYDSNDLTDLNGNVAKFDMDSPYYSLHGGLGYVWNMAEGHDLDVYGKYIWTRVQGTDDTLTTKDKFEYDDVDSNRVRFGVRYTYKGSERFSPYIGAAFEHEFSGSCDSRVYGHSVASPSFEGSSGMGELGLMMKPSEDVPLSINLGVQGYAGQKRGVSGSCRFVYEF